MVDSELGEIPKGWGVNTILNEFNINMGQSPKGETYNVNGEGITFFQGRSDFGLRFPTERIYTTAPKKIAEKFETLLSVRAPVGDINMAEKRCCIGRGLSSISHPENYYSYTYYKIRSIQGDLKSYDNEGTVFGSINKVTLGNIKTIQSPIFLTYQYNELVTENDKLIFNLTNQIKELTTLRDTLLPKLISGELAVSQIQNLP
jgi:type I restriction enzyme S subunit